MIMTKAINCPGTLISVEKPADYHLSHWEVKANPSSPNQNNSFLRKLRTFPTILCVENLEMYAFLNKKHENYNKLTNISR